MTSQLDKFKARYGNINNRPSLNKTKDHNNNHFSNSIKSLQELPPRITKEQQEELNKYIHFMSYIKTMKPTFNLTTLLPKKHRATLNRFLNQKSTEPFRITGGRGSLTTQFCLTSALLTVSKGDGDVIMLASNKGTEKAYAEQMDWILGKSKNKDVFTRHVGRFTTYTCKTSNKNLYIFTATNSQLVSRFLSHPGTSLVIIDDAQYIPLEIIQDFGKNDAYKFLISYNAYDNYTDKSFSGKDPRSLLRLTQPNAYFCYNDVPKAWLGKNFFVEASTLKKLNEDTYNREYLAKPPAAKRTAGN